MKQKPQVKIGHQSCETGRRQRHKMRHRIIERGVMNGNSVTMSGSREQAAWLPKMYHLQLSTISIMYPSHGVDVKASTLWNDEA